MSRKYTIEPVAEKLIKELDRIWAKEADPVIPVVMSQSDWKNLRTYISALKEDAEQAEKAMRKAREQAEQKTEVADNLRQALREFLQDE